MDLLVFDHNQMILISEYLILVERTLITIEFEEEGEFDHDKRLGIGGNGVVGKIPPAFDQDQMTLIWRHSITIK